MHRRKEMGMTESSASRGIHFFAGVAMFQHRSIPAHSQHVHTRCMKDARDAHIHSQIVLQPCIGYHLNW
jgi:hypothetical protein